MNNKMSAKAILLSVLMCTSNVSFSGGFKLFKSKQKTQTVDAFLKELQRGDTGVSSIRAEKNKATFDNALNDLQQEKATFICEDDSLYHNYLLSLTTASAYSGAERIEWHDLKRRDAFGVFDKTPFEVGYDLKRDVRDSEGEYSFENLHIVIGEADELPVIIGYGCNDVQPIQTIEEYENFPIAQEIKSFRRNMREISLARPIAMAAYNNARMLLNEYQTRGSSETVAWQVAEDSLAVNSLINEIVMSGLNRSRCDKLTEYQETYPDMVVTSNRKGCFVSGFTAENNRKREIALTQ